MTLTDSHREKQGDQSGSEPIRIEPIPFRAKPPAKRRPLANVFKWSAAFVFIAVLVCLCLAVWFVFTARQVVITLSPAADRIFISGGFVSPEIGGHYLLRPGQYRLTAWKDCYFPLEHPFQVSTEKRQNLALTLQKRPGRLNLSAHSKNRPTAEIAGARVTIDGADVGKTPLKDHPLSPGPHVLQISAENYQSARKQLTIDGCDRLQELNLALLPAWSDVSIASLPEGASVWIDNRLFGKTPLKIRLAAGTYTLKVGAERYKTRQQPLVVEPNRPMKIKALRLEPANGRLVIETTPAGASVMIGAKFMGRSPLTVDLAPSESHEVRILKAGYEKTTRRVTLSPATSQPLVVELKPHEGLVRLSVEPADAELLVDAESVGTVPRQLRLVAIPHTLEFKKDGYLSYHAKITPRPGFPQQLDIVLKKVTVAPKTIPTLILAETGDQLKLILPRSFTMGSSRREQGRRSNETLRTIDLKRPFYMGLKEVTNQAFRQFLPRHRSGRYKSRDLDGPDLPVVNVTWQEAAQFCNWLSAKASLPPAYRQKQDKLAAVEPLNTGFRLPTEAEWEFCARHVDQRTLRKYPWGNTFPPKAASGNYADQSAKDLLPTIVQGYNDGHAAASPPGQFKANPFGLYDMGGNVAEWCHDLYSIYSYRPGKIYVDPAGPNAGQHHVIKGASWKDGSIGTLRLAYRGYGQGKREDVGFRVCRYVE